MLNLLVSFQTRRSRLCYFCVVGKTFVPEIVEFVHIQIMKTNNKTNISNQTCQSKYMFIHFKTDNLLEFS